METDFKINVNRFNSSEKLISLVKVSHPSLYSDLTIVNDTHELVLGDDVFLPFPFRLKMDDQVEGQLPKASLIIPNSGGQIAKWIDSTLGGMGSSVEVILTRRSSLKKDHSVKFELDSVTVNNKIITLSLSIQNNLIKKAIRWTYDRKHAPGLF